MTVSILICTHGDQKWEELAYSRAFPSTIGQHGDPQVIVHHDEEGTLAQSRNDAAHLALRPWLCFLDADDELHPNYLMAMGRAMKTGELLAPAVQYLVDGAPRGRAFIPNRGRWPDLNECVIGTLIPRRLFLDLGGFRELPSLEDYDLFLRAYIAGARITHVRGAVYRAHVNPVGRNRDQSVYHALTREHSAAWRKA